MTTGTITIRGIDISTYPVKDADRAVTFYRDVVGMMPSEVWPGQGAEFELPDGATFGLWKMEATPGGGVMFAVDDARSAVRTLMDRGVKFMGDGHIEETPVCFMAFGEDTEGNSFIIHQRKNRD